MNHFYSPIDKALYKMFVISKKELIEKGENMKHRFTIKNQSQHDGVIDHELVLQKSISGRIVLCCLRHQETVVTFYPHHAEFMHESCMRHGAVTIPFEIHHYKDVHNADKKE